MISTLGWIAILIIIGAIIILTPTNNEDGCYEKDVYTCLKCKKNCKWHDMAEKFENDRIKTKDKENDNGTM